MSFKDTISNEKLWKAVSLTEKRPRFQKPASIHVSANEPLVTAL